MLRDVVFAIVALAACNAKPSMAGDAAAPSETTRPGTSPAASTSASATSSRRGVRCGAGTCDEGAVCCDRKVCVRTASECLDWDTPGSGWMVTDIELCASTADCRSGELCCTTAARGDSYRAKHTFTSECVAATACAGTEHFREPP